MTARYFAVNSLAGCSRTSTAVIEAGSSTVRDAAYVPNGILLPTGNDWAAIKGPFLDGSTSISGTFYLRFDIYSGIYNTTNGFVTMLSAGVNAYRMQATGSGVTMQYWNTGTSAWVVWGSNMALTTGLTTIVLKLTPNVGFEVFQGGTSKGSSAVVPTNGVAAVDEFRLQCAGGASSYFSQVMCADYDIRDAHLMPATISGDSAANTSGTGAYTDVNELALDESTALVLAAAGKKGQTRSAITVPAGYGIGALVTYARGRVSGGTVTDGKLGVRVGSTNYSSGALLYNGGYEPRGAIWAANPATSGGWTQTTFNAAETYEEAV